MLTKYQRALGQLKQDRTWQQVADKLTDALGETVHRSDPWNVYNNKSGSRKVEVALEQMGLIPKEKPRYRLACEFVSEEERESFRRFYGLYNDYTFTNLVYDVWYLEKARDAQ